MSTGALFRGNSNQALYFYPNDKWFNYVKTQQPLHVMHKVKAVFFQINAGVREFTVGAYRFNASAAGWGGFSTLALLY